MCSHSGSSSSNSRYYCPVSLALKLPVVTKAPVIKIRLDIKAAKHYSPIRIVVRVAILRSRAVVAAAVVVALPACVSIFQHNTALKSNL